VWWWQKIRELPLVGNKNVIQYYNAALCTVCFMRHRWHSRLLNIHSFRAADCDTDHCPVFVKVRERLAVSKQEGQKFDVERLNLRRQHELEVRK
jgi:hypothetical protein